MSHRKILIYFGISANNIVNKALLARLCVRSACYLMSCIMGTSPGMHNVNPQGKMQLQRGPRKVLVVTINK